MIRKNESLKVVINGDWNRLFVQPDWIAKNVFEREQIEIGITGLGKDFSISYKSDGVIILPTQLQVIFAVEQINSISVGNLCSFINSFMEKSFTSQIISFGFNTDYIDDGAILANQFDNIERDNSLFDLGCEILVSSINRKIKYNNNIYNVDFSLEKNRSLVHINEHHEGIIKKEDFPSISEDDINNYLNNCWSIIQALGYEREENE